MPRSMDEVSRQVQWLTDISEITQLQARYAHYLNAVEPELLIGLFADHDEVEIELSNKGIFAGRTAPQRVFGGNHRQREIPGILNMHLSQNPVIHVEDDRSRAKALWMSPGISTFPYGGEIVPAWSWGKYETEYVIENGEWKLLVFRWHQIFLTPYDKGWVADSMDPDFDGARGAVPDRESAPGFYAPYRADKARGFGPLPPESHHPWQRAEMEPR
jgi:hypothetical protein